jgi:hypothetical protein
MEKKTFELILSSVAHYSSAESDTFAEADTLEQVSNESMLPTICWQ